MRALCLALALLGTACSTTLAPVATAAPTAFAPAYPLQIADDTGTTRVFATAPARIVSLAPSVTETIYAIGAGDRLVAVDDYSDHPPAAKTLPKLGGVRASTERIVAQRADVIFAITSGDLADRLSSAKEPVVVLDPVGLDGVYANVLLIGRILDRQKAAADLVSSMKSRIGAVAERAKTATTRPRVMHEVDATDPARIYVAGPKSFIDEIVTLVGGQNIASAASLPKYPRFSPEEIVRADPEIIVLSDARFGATAEIVMARPGYAQLSAVTAKRIFPIDDDLVSRPGPRLVDGVEAYARLVHPEIFR